MTNFLSSEEKKYSKEFEEKGYLIEDIVDKNSLKEIREIFTKSVKKNLKVKFKKEDPNYIFNNIHKYLDKNNLNDFRLKVINDVNQNKFLREFYYKISNPYLNILAGNEIAMQMRINLSIQFPGDDSSLLPLHSDVWSGDSPYEIVSWLPLVDCYKTKAMYILPPNKYEKLNSIIKKNKSASEIFTKIKKDLKWIEIDYGKILLFNQCLPHGNVVNVEKETRWSLNCRFKSILTPYSDKKIGEFFEPITLRKLTQLGMKFKLPKFDD